MNTRMLLAGVVILLCAVSTVALAGERHDAESSAQRPDFSSKVLLVYLGTEKSYPTYIILKARLRQIGNRLFLCGEGADTRRKEDWRSGLETNIAWDSVTSFQVLTADQYTKYLDDAHAER